MLTLQRETLLEALQYAIGAVERRHTKPILANFLLFAKDHKLTIIGTDLEIELTGIINLTDEITQPISTTVPARKLTDICRSLPENSLIKIVIEPNKLLLSAGRSKFTLTTLPVDDFPEVPKQKNDVEFSLPQSILKTLAEKTYFAIPQQDVRNYLNGMLLEVQNSTITAAASDGHRLALSTAELTIDQQIFAQVIVPRKGILEIMRLTSHNNELITIGLNNNCLQIQSEKFILVSKLIAGKFPNYHKSIPKNGNIQIKIKCEPLKQSVMRVAILSNELHRSICFQLEDNLLKLFSKNPEQEEAIEELEIEYQEEPLEIKFNINYLMDILNSTSITDTLVFTLKNAEAGVIIEENNNLVKNLHVLMPIRR